MKKYNILFLFLILLVFCACSKSEESQLPDVTEQYEELFNTTLVLTTHAYISGVARTVGDGMPMKFYFSYDINSPEELILEFKEFTYGSMPITINFRAHIAFLAADDDDGEERVRIYCDDAFTVAGDMEIGEDERGNAKVDGYFYPETEEIEVFVSFNMMNVTAYSDKQVIDLTRINRYDEEMEAYEIEHEEANN